MDSRVLFSFSYLGSTKLVSINDSTSYTEVLGEITEFWPNLLEVNYRLSCKIGEVSKIWLVSQEDLVNVVLMCGILGCRLVYVNIILSGESKDYGIGSLMVPQEDVGGNRQRSLLNGEIEIGNNQCAIGMANGCVDVISNTVVHSNSNCLLSDGWGDLMKGGVGTYYSGSAANFRIALIKYCSKVGARINYIRNSPSLFHIVCFYNLEEGCNWFVKARYDEGKKSFFVYSAVVDHTCGCQLFSKPSHDMLTPRVIADLLIPNVQNNSKICAKDVIDAMKVGYGFEIPYWKANRAAVLGRGRVYGSHYESYDTMFYYCKALQITNPGSAVVFELEPNSNRFQRVFISLSASMKDFKSCVPMLFVDGTFLKGRAKGILLVAIGKDGNRGLFPFAFALVSAENTHNWAWFLSLVKECVKHDSKVYYFSDRNAGLMAAFPIVFQEAVHFFCLYHLLSNLKTRFSGGILKEKKNKYHRLFKECAYELDLDVFSSKITEFVEIGGKKAIEFLSQLPYEKWAIAFAPIMARFGEMTSNAAECFNSWLLAARSLPITKLFDAIRFGICRWFVERHNASKLFEGLLVPRRQDDWNRLATIGLKWQINLCPGGVFKVISNPSACVDLNARVCSCNVWQSVGFPCAHAVAVIRKERSYVKHDVEVYFLASTYRECYSGVINPVCEMTVNDLKSKSLMPKIEAPVLTNPPGRPKSKKRLLSHVEVAHRRSKSGKCKKCGCCDKHDVWTCGSVNKDIDLNILAQPDGFE